MMRQSKQISSSDRWALWLKKNLFPSPLQSSISIIVFSLIIFLLGKFSDWLLINSVWSGDAELCRASSGACLAFLKEKWTFILFGFYPKEELARPVIGLLIFFFNVWWSLEPKRWSKKLLLQWTIVYLVLWALMQGGVLGLSFVSTSKWGGLPLTLLLASLGIIFSYPIGIVLALSRRGSLPLLKVMSVLYIELIRGVPLISLLFMASVMFPLFLPEGVSFLKLLRAQIAIIMFMSAYMAEVIRGGLASVPKGQYEAADALGLNYFQAMRLIILPQALKMAIPPSINIAIGLLKDTSLVVIIALFDLLMTTKTSIKDGDWLGLSLEAYLFVAIIYFILCSSLGRYGRRLEVELSEGQRQ